MKIFSLLQNDDPNGGYIASFGMSYNFERSQFRYYRSFHNPSNRCNGHKWKRVQPAQWFAMALSELDDQCFDPLGIEMREQWFRDEVINLISDGVTSLTGVSINFVDGAFRLIIASDDDF